MKYIQQLFELSKNHQHITAIALYSVIVSIIAYPIFLHQTNIFIDQLLHIPPMYTFWRDQILQGNLPLWNPNIFIGLPYLADPAHPVFNPFNVLFLFFNVYTAINVQLLLVLTLSGLGAYFMSSKFNLSNQAKLLAGLFYILAGSTIESLGDLNTLFGVMLSPWLIWAFLDDYSNFDQRIFPKFIGILFIFFLSGHPQYIYYSLIVIFSLLLLKQIFNFDKDKIVTFTVSLVVGFLLSSIQIIPTLELLQQTQRSDNIATSGFDSIQLVEIPRFIFPTIYGQINQGNSWGPQSDIYRGLANTQGFVSVVALGLVLLGLQNINHRNLKVNAELILFLSLTLVFLGLSFGNSTPLYGLAQSIIPGFGMFRSPGRILSMYSLLLAILAGMSFERIKFKNIDQKIILILILIFCIGLLGMLVDKSLLLSWLSTITTIPNTLAYPPIKIKQIIYLMFQSLFVFSLGLLGLTMLFRYKVNKSSFYFAIGLFFILTEAFIGVRGNLVWAPIDKLDPDPRLVKRIQQLSSPSSRIASITDLQDYLGIWPYFNHLRVMDHMMPDSPVSKSEYQDWQELEQHLSVFPANTHMLHQLSSMTGYVAILPQSYRQYWDSDLVNSINFPTDLTDPRYNHFGLKYLITDASYDPVSKFDQYILIEEIGSTRIYQNTTVRPRAEFINQNHNSVTSVEDVNANHVRVNINTRNNDTLILRDYYYPGWIALADGNPIQIQPHQQIYRQVEIPAGTQTLDFIYRPTSFYLGAAISLITGLLLIIFIACKQPRANAAWLRLISATK